MGSRHQQCHPSLEPSHTRYCGKKLSASLNKRHLAIKIKMGGHKKCVFLVTIARVSDRVSRHMAILEEWKPCTTWERLAELLGWGWGALIKNVKPFREIFQK